MRKINLTLFAILPVVAVILAGCLTSSTAVITVKLSPNAQGDPIRVSDQLYSTNGEIQVNLHDNATFKDYENDIRNIENIGFYLSVTNNDPDDVVFQMFLEPDTAADYDSVQQVLDNYVELLIPHIAVPANKRVTLDWGQSVKYVESPQYFADVIKSGVFSLYVGAVPHEVFDLTLDSLVLVITLTGTK